MAKVSCKTDNYGQSSVESKCSQNLDASKRSFGVWLGDMMISAIRLYQKGRSPASLGRCRFSPTCSHYAVEAIRRYGPLSGGFRSLWRFVRCNPFNKGGYDPPCQTVRIVGKSAGMQEYGFPVNLKQENKRNEDTGEFHMIGGTDNA